jgi:hypothetical protein
VTEWLSVAELVRMALPALPATHGKILQLATRENWQAPEHENTLWRHRAGRGGGVEYHVSRLPIEAQSAIALRAPANDQPDTRKAKKARIERSEIWAWFERLPEKKRQAAAERAQILDAWARLSETKPKTLAAMLIARQSDIAVATLNNWADLVLGVARADWAPYLAPRHAGCSAKADCATAAWDYLRADYLRPERPTFAACFRRLEKVAQAQGWTLPSARTLQRRLEDIPEGVRVAGREGVEALKQLFPAQERSRAHFHALEAVNVDGHKWDVFVRWPDGDIGRPMMVAFQDLYSGKLLAWRVDKSENKESTRLAFGDIVEQFGIPDKCWLDNGRAFASKWISGGTPNRYRFKVKDEEPLGLLTLLGVEMHWTAPYSGQSKPIERAFRDFAGDTAKHPKFAGAYVGNSPMAKPENYGSAAVPLDVFLQVVGEAVVEHNSREGRDTDVCRGRSFDAAFSESYAAAPIRKATDAQRRLWLMAAESVLCARRDGSITLEGNRYWSGCLTGLRGSRVTVRFDPQVLHQDLHVYAPDGRYLGAAECVEAVGFDDVEAAKTHARARNAWMRAQKIALEAEKKMSLAQVAALLPETAAPVAPATKVVRPVFGNTALKPRETTENEQTEAEILLMRGLNNRLRAVND